MPPEALKGVDIIIQNVNLREIFSAVRKSFSAPNEVSGHVTKSPGSVLAAVEWPRAPAPASGGQSLTQFLAPSQTDVQSSAAYIACSLSWARAVEVKGALANVPRVQFCDFSRALGNLYALSDKASTPDGLADPEAALVRKRAAELRAHYGTATILSDLYRLRADLLDLIPERLRTTNELVEAQEDRLSYAMLSPNLQKLPDAEKRFAAQALARPAIVFSGEKLDDIPQNWTSLLLRRESDIARVARSTGLLVTNDKRPVGSAFVVAPNLAITAAHVIDGLHFGAKRKSEDKAGGILCFGNDLADCKELSIGSVVFKGEVGKDDIALIELPNHNPVLIPPLTIADPLPKANVIVGRYAYVVGFSFIDTRLPVEFLDRLLAKISGKKRLMPGRILGFGVYGSLTREEHPRFTSDISTTSGTSGAPLIDLSSGEVFGVNRAGEWQGERGKFSYAIPIPEKVREIIASRNRGELIKVMDLPKSRLPLE